MATRSDMIPREHIIKISCSMQFDFFKGAPRRSGKVTKTDPTTLVKISEICEEGKM